MSEEKMSRLSHQGSALIKASTHLPKDGSNHQITPPKNSEGINPDTISEASEESSETGEEASGILQASRDLERYNRLYRSGAYEEAVEGYQLLINGLGEEKILANLGYALQSLERHQEAAEAFEAYLKVFMARHHAWKALCFSYYHLQDYENMTRCAREAIKWDIRLDTPDDYSWQQMATAHFLMQDYSTALKATRKASALNPHNPYSRYYEACIIATFVDGPPCDEPTLFEEPPSYEAAAELLTDALEIRPDLEDELRKEGYLDQVFPLLESIRTLRKARKQEDQSAQEEVQMDQKGEVP